MSPETVKFSSYEEQCFRIQQAVQREFGEMPVGRVEIHIVGKDRANIVIPVDDQKTNILPTNLVVPIRLDTEVRIAKITQLAREFYNAVIAPFANLSVNLSDPHRPQWNNKRPS